SQRGHQAPQRQAADRAPRSGSGGRAPALPARLSIAHDVRGGNREVNCPGVAPSIENFLDVAHSVQHANDLNGLSLGIVDDEVGVDWPEFTGRLVRSSRTCPAPGSLPRSFIAPRIS